MTYTVEQVRNIRGFQALTQGEDRLVELLVNNINELKGKKALGIKKTRIEVLKSESSKEELYDFIVLLEGIKETGLMIEKLDAFTSAIAVGMTEKVFRTHVTPQILSDIVEGVLNRLSILGSVDMLIDSLQGYLTCGQVVPITETCRQFDVEIKEGRIIFNEPTFRYAS